MLGIALLCWCTIKTVRFSLFFVWNNDNEKCGPMPNVMAAVPNIGGALCWTPQFGWRPLLECRAVTMLRRQTRWNYQGVPKTNETISAASGPKFTILWGHVEEILLLNKFFLIVDTCLSCEDIAWQSCAMVPRWRFWQLFCVLHLQRVACSTFQTWILNLH